jgi:hypothetical protein
LQPPEAVEIDVEMQAVVAGEGAGKGVTRHVARRGTEATLGPVDDIVHPVDAVPQCTPVTVDDDDPLAHRVGGIQAETLAQVDQPDQAIPVTEETGRIPVAGQVRQRRRRDHRGDTQRIGHAAHGAHRKQQQSALVSTIQQWRQSRGN